MHTKTPITLRVDPDLLAAARDQAQAENRTLTNFIETVLKERLGSRLGAEQDRAGQGQGGANEAHRHS